MECSELRKLDASVVEERCGRNENGIGPLATYRFEGSVDLGTRVSLEDLGLESYVARRRLYFS